VIPAPKFSVVITGLMIILGGLSIFFGAYVKIGAMLLIIFLIPTSLIMHNYWKVNDAMAKATEMAQFFKNMALAGAAFLIWYFGTGPLSLIP
jgi:putative oxidoreductase